MRDRFLFATIISVLCLTGCTLSDVEEYGDACPPRVMVNDDGEFVRVVSVTGDIVKTHCCDEKGNDVDTCIKAERKNNKYVDKGGKAYLLIKDYEEFVAQNHATPGLSKISPDCDSRETCLEKYRDNIERELCPKDFSICSFDGEYYCHKQVAQCYIDNDCLELNPTWVSGRCKDMTCFVNECKKGYWPNSDENSCVQTCEPGKHVNQDKTGCDLDDNENCGAFGSKCGSWFDHSKSEICQEGKCVINECNEKFELFEGKCISSVCEGNTYWNTQENKCTENNNDNCGEEGNVCEYNADKHWATSHCVNGECVVSICEDGFNMSKLDTDECIRCDDGYQYHTEKKECVPESASGNDIEHCGEEGLNCNEMIANAKTVACKNGKCVADECKDGFKLDNGHCIISCTDSQYLDPDTGKCLDSDINNCGEKGLKCILGTNDSAVDCLKNQCIITDCKTGYYLNNGKCVQTTSKDCCPTNGKLCISCDVDHQCINNKCEIESCALGSANCGYGCKTLTELLELHLTAKCACVSGYEDKDGDKRNGCEATVDIPGTTFSDCGESHVDCRKDGALQGNCVDGECDATKCDSGYRLTKKVNGTHGCLKDFEIIKPNQCPEQSPVDCNNDGKKCCPTRADCDKSNGIGIACLMTSPIEPIEPIEEL